MRACRGQSFCATEIIVVDDGSEDNTAEIAEKEGAHCLRREHSGPASARNAGARVADADFIAFTDADCVPDENWLQNLTKALSDPVVAAGGSYGIANPTSRLARIVHEEILNRHQKYSDIVDFIGSYNMICSKKVFEKIGGFDESFKQASAEDNDFAYRLTAAGWQIRHVPTAVVNHYHPERLLPYLKTQFRHGFWRVHLYQKHPARMTRGDDYAGFGELVAPVVALFSLSSLFASLFLMASQFHMSLLLFASGIAAFVYGCLMRVPDMIAMYKRTKDVAFFLYPLLCFQRDIARGLGMLKGVIVFGLLKKSGQKCRVF